MARVRSLLATVGVPAMISATIHVEPTASRLRIFRSLPPPRLLCSLLSDGLNLLASRHRAPVEVCNDRQHRILEFWAALRTDDPLTHPIVHEVVDAYTAADGPTDLDPQAHMRWQHLPAPLRPVAERLYWVTLEDWDPCVLLATVDYDDAIVYADLAHATDDIAAALNDTQEACLLIDHPAPHHLDALARIEHLGDDLWLRPWRHHPLVLA